MRRVVFLIVSLTAIFAGVLYAAPAHAFDVFGGACSGGGADSAVCQDKTKGSSNPLTGSNGVLIKIANVIAVAAGVLAIFVIIMAGWKYVTSGGDTAKIQAAKHTLMYAIIGLIVIALSDTIIGFVLSKL
jgi:hypothetical protein